MATVLSVSMVCFPYVIMGFGQAIIAGTMQAGRTVHGTEEVGRRTSILAAFENARTPSLEVSGIPKYPALSLRSAKSVNVSGMEKTFAL